jgi:cold shock CspA family protein
MKQQINSQNTLQKGVLLTWNDQRGFGFIFPEHAHENEKIFIHISAFGKISRRPKEGDIIYYRLQIRSNHKNKYSAVNASIEGVKSDNRIPTAHHSKLRNNSVSTHRKTSKRLSRKPAKKGISLMQFIVGFMVCLLIFVYGISKMISPASKMEESWIEPPVLSSHSESSHSQEYYCAGKVYCSEMDSCEEARYYLHNCPDVKIDGDGDGMPCEQQCGD